MSRTGGEKPSVRAWRLLWDLAGIVGVDPGALTLRELAWMAEARSRAAWKRTSSVLALVANVHRDPEKCRARKPEDFDPYHAGDSDVVIDGGGFKTLKQFFVDRKGG